MNSGLTISSSVLAPIAMPIRIARTARNAISSDATATGAENRLPAIVNESLKTLGGLSGSQDDALLSSIQSALQDNLTLSPLATSPQTPSPARTPALPNPELTTPLMLEALGQENPDTATGEIPFIPPYQLGLQETLGFTSPIQTPSPENAQPATTQATSQETTFSEVLQNINAPGTVAGTAALGTVGFGDPTGSSLFQSMAGSTAPAVLTPAPSVAGFTEAPLVLPISATIAGSATTPYSADTPLNSDIIPLSILVAESGVRRAPLAGEGSYAANLPSVGMNFNREG